MKKPILLLGSLILSTLNYALPPAISSDVDNPGQTALEISRSAHDKVDAVIEALINPSSCVYDPDFACTRENLTHIYQIETWTTPGNYTWTVPSGITQIYATMVSGQGGRYLEIGHEWYGRICSSRPVFGGISSVSTLNASVSTGAGSIGYCSTSCDPEYGDHCTVIISNPSSDRNSDYINVSSGQIISIIIGAGGSGNPTGNNGSASIKY